MPLHLRASKPCMSDGVNAAANASVNASAVASDLRSESETLWRMKRLGHMDGAGEGALDKFDQITRRQGRAMRALDGERVGAWFDAALRMLAELSIVEQDYPGIVPAIRRFAPFLHVVKAGREIRFKTQPALRHFYMPDDFRAVVEAVMAASPMTDPLMTSLFMTPSLGSGRHSTHHDADYRLRDYLPLDGVSIEGASAGGAGASAGGSAEGIAAGGASTRGERIIKIEGGVRFSQLASFYTEPAPDSPFFEAPETEIPVAFSQIGARLAVESGAIHVLQVLFPHNQGTAKLVERAVGCFFGRDIPAEDIVLLHATHMTVGPRPVSERVPRVSSSWIALDRRNHFEGNTGWSDHAAGNRVLSEDQIVLGKAMTSTVFLPAVRAGVEMMALPQYFALQLDRIESDVLDFAGEEARPGAGQAGAGSARAGRAHPRKAKGFRVVRALRSPSWEGRIPDKYPSGQADKADPSSTASPDGSAPHAAVRREPETQVPVCGYWRSLAPGSIGAGPQGEPSVGRTWVVSHVRWRDKPPPPDLPLFKEPVARHLFDPRRQSLDGEAVGGKAVGGMRPRRDRP